MKEKCKQEKERERLKVGAKARELLGERRWVREKKRERERE